MGTTALFAELVVGGVLTLTWMFLLAVTALGPSRFAPLLDVPPTLTTGLLLAVAYALGVVFDRVWDVLLDVKWLRTWFRGGSDSDKPASGGFQTTPPMTEWERKRRRLYGKDPKTAVDFVNYHRTRVRVARASLFNFTLIAASGLVLMGVRYGGVGTVEFALVAATGVLLCAASMLALWNLGRTHDRVLEIISIEEEADGSPTTDDTDGTAGPVPPESHAVRDKFQ